MSAPVLSIVGFGDDDEVQMTAERESRVRSLIGDLIEAGQCQACSTLWDVSDGWDVGEEESRFPFEHMVVVEFMPGVWSVTLVVVSVDEEGEPQADAFTYAARPL